MSTNTIYVFSGSGNCLDIAKNIAEPLSQIGDITIIGGGNGGNGVDTVADNVPIVMAKLFRTMKEATGVDFSEIMRADTYDAKVNRNININGGEGLKDLAAEALKDASQEAPSGTDITE